MFKNILSPLKNYRYGISNWNNQNCVSQNVEDNLSMLTSSYINTLRKPDIVIKTQFGTCLELALTIQFLFHNVGEVIILRKHHAVFYLPNIGCFDLNESLDNHIEFLSDKYFSMWVGGYGNSDVYKGCYDISNRNLVFRNRSEVIQI